MLLTERIQRAGFLPAGAPSKGQRVPPNTSCDTDSYGSAATGLEEFPI